LLLHWIASLSAAMTISFSRRDFASELCDHQATTPQKKFRAPDTHDPEKWRPVFGPDHAQKRRERSAAKAQTLEPYRRGTAARLAIGAPALRRSTAALA
jgi:hypothetical protein